MYFMLNATNKSIMLNAIMLNAIMLNVVAPEEETKNERKNFVS
jgi:hypothetical protein